MGAISRCLNLFLLHCSPFYQSQALDSVGLKDSDRRRFLEFVAATRLEECRPVDDPYALGALGFTMSAAPSTPPKSLMRPISSVSSRGRAGNADSFIRPSSSGTQTPIQLRKMAEQQRKLQQQQFGMAASESRSQDKRNLPLPPPHSASAPRFDPLAFHRNLLAQQQQNSPHKQQQGSLKGDDSRANETLSKGDESLGFSGKLRQGGAHTSNSVSRSRGNTSLGFSGKLSQGGAHKLNSLSRSRGTPKSVLSSQPEHPAHSSPEQQDADFVEYDSEAMRGPSMSMARGSLRNKDSATGSTSRSALSGFGVPLRGAPPPPEPLPSRLADRMKEQVKRSGEQANKFEQARYSMDRSKPADAHAVAVVTNRGVSSSSSRAHTVHDQSSNFMPVEVPPSKMQEKRGKDDKASKAADAPRGMMDDFSDFVGFQM